MKNENGMRLPFLEEKEQTSGWKGCEEGGCSSFMVWAYMNQCLFSYLCLVHALPQACCQFSVIPLNSRLTINVAPSAWNVLFASPISTTRLEGHHLDLRFPGEGSSPSPFTPDKFRGWGNGGIALGSIITLHCNPSGSNVSSL